MNERGPLRVFVYRSARNPRPNFGDVLSPWLIERCFGRRCAASDIRHADLVAIGSVLDYCHARRWSRLLHGRRASPWYWGTGTASDGPPLRIAPARVLAVRGPRTQARLPALAGRPVPCGDPALLLAEIVPARAPRHAIALAPHLNHQDSPALATLASALSPALVDVGEAIDTVIDTIARAELVIGSSLHALIAAAALGRPFIWCQPHDATPLDPWKFHDVFESLQLAPRRHAPAELATPSLERLHRLATRADPALVAARCADLRSAFAGAP